MRKFHQKLRDRLSGSRGCTGCLTGCCVASLPTDCSVLCCRSAHSTASEFFLCNSLSANAHTLFASSTPVDILNHSQFPSGKRLPFGKDGGTYDIHEGRLGREKKNNSSSRRPPLSGEISQRAVVWSLFCPPHLVGTATECNDPSTPPAGFIRTNPIHKSPEHRITDHLSLATDSRAVT